MTSEPASAPAAETKAEAPAAAATTACGLAKPNALRVIQETERAVVAETDRPVADLKVNHPKNSATFRFSESSGCFDVPGVYTTLKLDDGRKAQVALEKGGKLHVYVDDNQVLKQQL